MSSSSVDSIFSIVDSFISDAQADLNWLQFTGGYTTGISAEPVDIPRSTIADVTMPQLNAATLGVSPPPSTSLDASPVSASYTSGYADIAAISLQNFNSVLYKSYELPDALPSVSLGLPDLDYPETGFISVKSSAGLSSIDSANISVGAAPEFLDIPDISFNLTPIPVFSGDVPDTPDLPDVSRLDDPEYLVRDLDPELEAALSKAIDGQVMLPAEIQQAIIDLEVRKLNIEYYRKERQVMNASAAKGHSNIDGSAINDLSVLEYDAVEAEQDVFFKVREEAHSRAIKHLSEAIKQQLRLESANFALHLQYAEQLVDVLKFNVAQQTDYANLLVSMFNSKLDAVKQIIATYNTYVDTTLRQYKVTTSELDRERSVLDTNAAKLSVYESQIQTTNVQADVYTTDAKKAALALQEYSAYVKGLLSNVDIARANIQAFGDSTKMYSNAIDVNKNKIRAYADRVRATGSATGVYEANWNSYAKAQSTSLAAADARREWYNASLQSLRADIDKFSSAAAAQRSYYQSLETWSRANSSAAGQYEQASKTAASTMTTQNAQQVAYAQATMAGSLAAADTATKTDTLEAQARAIEESIKIGLTAAQATASAGFAQAANSIRSMSAGVSANASLQSSSSESKGVSNTTNLTNQKAYQKVQTLSL